MDMRGWPDIMGAPRNIPLRLLRVRPRKGRTDSLLGARGRDRLAAREGNMRRGFFDEVEEAERRYLARHKRKPPPFSTDECQCADCRRAADGQAPPAVI